MYDFWHLLGPNKLSVIERCPYGEVRLYGTNFTWIKKIVFTDQNIHNSCFMSFQFSKCQWLISIEQLREWDTLIMALLFLPSKKNVLTNPYWRKRSTILCKPSQLEKSLVWNKVLTGQMQPISSWYSVKRDLSVRLSNRGFPSFLSSAQIMHPNAWSTINVDWLPAMFWG